ncbi:hypothetical protein RHMOL_Rhmol02G0182300 [Rhododendron molle]|uniref:Uncharacterized protein n=1 Tax=Rhododendron molle TaxID=49168 RepID=A0ACC0PTW8_RHOML|nr:hypothetical protein RHMOL_Rhmol02G0182300 [Rhododendron molle]
MIHWDLVMHIFRNYDNEMCPMNMSHLLRMKLNISKELTASIIHDSELDIPRLIELYSPGVILENHVEQAHKRFAFSICALAAYALVPANGSVSPSVMSMASQMGARKNIIPTILAKTLMGLDLFKSRQSNIFSGSPRLLQVKPHSAHLFSVFHTFSFYLNARLRITLEPYLSFRSGLI